MGPTTRAPPGASPPWSRHRLHSPAQRRSAAFSRSVRVIGAPKTALVRPIMASRAACRAPDRPAGQALAAAHRPARGNGQGPPATPAQFPDPRCAGGNHSRPSPTSCHRTMLSALPAARQRPPAPIPAPAQFPDPGCAGGTKCRVCSPISTPPEPRRGSDDLPGCVPTDNSCKRHLIDPKCHVTFMVIYARSSYDSQLRPVTSLAMVVGTTCS